jgi:E3 ubiquitin-protein ligase UBR4
METFINCPRCSKKVSNKHGNCNGCGDNAFQCVACRNINYEKLDGFLCNECGVSRHVKIDFQIKCRKGFATERIENEDQKSEVMKQIDETLGQAQDNYKSLMSKRLQIGNLIAQLPKIEGAQVAEFYKTSCQDQYVSMMKHLTNVKVSKQEVHQFTM